MVPVAGRVPVAIRATGVPAKQQRKPRSRCRKPGECQSRNVQRAFLPSLYQAPPRTYSSTFIFNHKGWGKTTTKTEAVVTVAGIVPVAIRATGVPGNEVPSAPTKHPHTNSFDFHYLSFLLITKDGKKQQRKPTKSRAPGEHLMRYVQRAYLQAPPRTCLNFIF